MRWPLRNQIFLPFAGLLTVSVVLIAVVSAWNAAENSRNQKLQHMRSVVKALGDASFPLEQSVADRIAAMIAGDVIVVNFRGEVTAATTDAPTALMSRLLPLAAEGKSVQDAQTITWMKQEYLVTVIRRTNVARPATLFVLIPQEHFSALQRNSIIPPLLVAVPTLVLALVLAMLISGRISGRVNLLRDLFRRISHGDFQSLSVVGRNDEIRDLMISANELSDRLRQMQQELLRTERLQLLGQLSGGLAHQLRNSITGAKLAIQLHERNCSATSDTMLETAVSQLRLTEEQVLAVLSLRPDSNQPDNPTTVDVVQMADHVRMLLQPQCAHWKSSLTVNADGNEVKASVISESCLKGALLNLVLNGIEAAGVGGRVQIAVERHSDMVWITVRDDGPGFTDNAESLTDVFQTTKPDGIGLGLTIARHAVSQESGELLIDRDGDWTSVRISIPSRHAAPKEVMT